MSRSAQLAHLRGVHSRLSRAIAPFVCLVAGLGGVSCTAETTVIGDDRARYACMDAPELDAPPIGCTTVRLIPDGPWGCSVTDEGGGWLEELSGSWVRLHREEDQNVFLRVTAVDPAPRCEDDDTCFVRADLRIRGAPPCTCVFGSLDSMTLLPGESRDTYLGVRDAEVLVGPVGAEVEVSLCTEP